MLLPFQDLADATEAVRRILPQGKCFVLVIVEAGEHSEAVQVCGNIDLESQLNLLQAGFDAVMEPSQQAIIKARPL